MIPAESFEAAFARAASFGKVAVMKPPGGLVRAEIAIGEGESRVYARGAASDPLEALLEALAEVRNIGAASRPAPARPADHGHSGPWYCEVAFQGGWSSQRSFGRAPFDLPPTAGEAVVKTASGQVKVRRVMPIPDAWRDWPLSAIRDALDIEGAPPESPPHDGSADGFIIVPR
jgi:hypothetical protein